MTHKDPSVQVLSTACECVVWCKLRQSIIIIMPRSSEVYGSVFVCVCLFVCLCV